MSIILERGREIEGGMERRQREGEGERGEGRVRKNEKGRHRYTQRVLLFYVYLIGYSCHSQS